MSSRPGTLMQVQCLVHLRSHYFLYLDEWWPWAFEPFAEELLCRLAGRARRSATALRAMASSSHASQHGVRGVVAAHAMHAAAGWRGGGADENRWTRSGVWVQSRHR